MNHLEAGRAKVETHVGAALDKAAAWPEGMLGASRAVTAKKRRPANLEQSELWPSPSSVDFADDISTTSGAGEAMNAIPALLEPVPVIEAKRLRPAVARAAKSAGRRLVAAPVAASREPGMPGKSIARFLNVNGAIEGMRTGGIRFDLPGRRLSTTLRLWRGTAEAEEYTPVYY